MKLGWVGAASGPESGNAEVPSSTVEHLTTASAMGCAASCSGLFLLYPALPAVPAAGARHGEEAGRRWPAAAGHRH